MTNIRYSQFLNFKQYQNSYFWLLAIAAAIVTVQISLFLIWDEGRLFESFILFGGAIAYLIWDRYPALRLESSIFASVFGGILIGLVLLKSTTLGTYDPFLRIVPLLLLFGLALLASGFRGLSQYGREFLLICFFIPPPSTVSRIFDISPWAATLGETILYYLGFQVVRENVFIYIPNGGVEVYYGCSGIESMIHLLGLSVLLIALFPTNLWQKILLPCIAMAIAFFVNGFRIALLTLLSESSQNNSFEYWHTGTGSLIFSIISVLIFGYFFYYFFYRDTTIELDAANELEETDRSESLPDASEGVE
jgi:cyanoexosortase A